MKLFLIFLAKVEPNDNKILLLKIVNTTTLFFYLQKMDAKSKTQAAPVKIENQVHKDIIHGETIRKEMKYADRNIMLNSQLNPHNSISSSNRFPIVNFSV